MSCLLLIAGTCFLDPATITLRAESVWQSDTERAFYFHQGRPYAGPLGRIELVVDVELPRGFRLHYGYGHQSYLHTHRDRAIFERILPKYERWRIPAESEGRSDE